MVKTLELWVDSSGEQDDQSVNIKFNKKATYCGFFIINTKVKVKIIIFNS